MLRAKNVYFRCIFWLLSLVLGSQSDLILSCHVIEKIELVNSNVQ